MFADACGSAARSRKGKALAAAVIAVLAMAGLETPASARDVRCGDVITEDTKLNEDLLDCPGNGLEIGASVTLDLGGHVIDGDGDGGVGIVSHATDRVERVQIKNGTVREFRTGVAIGRDPSASRTHHHLVTQLAVVDNAGNGISASYGFIPGGGGQFDTTVERNTVARNGAQGIVLFGGQNTVARNTLVGNGGGGLVLNFATRVTGLQGNLVRNNRVIANGGDGITAESHTFPVSINQIERNDVIANERDGIWLAGSGGNLERNRTHRNGDDGIDVDCRFGFAPTCSRGLETTLRRNAANRNGDLGIEADPGFNDGGRNTARATATRLSAWAWRARSLPAVRAGAAELPPS